MATRQRMKNDNATEYRRDVSDAVKKDNRDRNDELTRERRVQADKAMEQHRLKNDEMTDNRRKRNDRNPWRTFAIWLLILIILAAGVCYFFL